MAIASLKLCYGRRTEVTPAQAGGADAVLRKELGFVALTASGVGIIIGAGIYVLIGAATEKAGAPVWEAFLLAAVLSALTGLGYCELATMFPRAAAEFEYSRHAFPPWIAFLTGWVMISGLTIASATVSLGFAEYLAHFFDIPVRAGAVLLLVFVTAVALGGIRNSARLTIGLSLIQVGGLLFVIAVGAGHVGEVDVVSGGSANGIIGAAALVFFAFIGFDEVTTLAEETRNPGRDVPLALIVALAISTVLYIGVAIVAVSVLGAEALGQSATPLADVVGEATGRRLDDMIAVVALVSTTNTTLLALTAGSRVMYGMAAVRALPPFLAQVTRRRQAPARAIILCAVISIAFALTGELTLVASVTDFSVYLVFLSVNSTVIVLRFRRPEAKRPFRIPWAIGRVPVIPVLGFAATALLMTGLDGKALLIGAALSSVGLVVGWLIARRTGWVARLEAEEAAPGA